MEKERSIDTLARYVLIAAALALGCAVAWYFRSVLVYIIAAFVISLVGRPVMKLLRLFRIKGKSAPDWLLAALTLIIILGVLLLLLTQAVPVVSAIVRDASFLDAQGGNTLSLNPLDRINQWLIATFPKLGPDYRVESVLLAQLKDFVDINKISSSLSSLIGSVASAVSSFAVGTFAAVFISFFFIKDEKLFSRIIGALVPDRLETATGKAISEIEHLLSRYFVGLIIEVTGVAVLDFLGLWAICRLSVGSAVGIAVLAGILNVIPYVGPLFGYVIGVVLGVVLKLGGAAGLDVNVWVFALIILAVMVFTQLVDNFVYQPLIYSTSIKAHPLEIFIVLLVAGHIGGTFGMLVAIPAYTVVRVIASRFFYHMKAIRRLIPNLQEETKSLTH